MLHGHAFRWNSASTFSGSPSFWQWVRSDRTALHAVIPWYGHGMARTRKVTITLPAELLESMKSHTDNVSGYLTELAERAERRRLLREELDRYQGEFGAFTEEEMAAARALLHGTQGTDRAA